MSTSIQTPIVPDSNNSAIDRRQEEPARIFVHGDGRRTQTDRRQKSIPVEIERRMNANRRNSIDRRGIQIHLHNGQDRTGIS